MPDSTQIEAQQTRLAAQVRQANRDAAMRLALDELVPTSRQELVSYAEVLRRLAAAITEELRSLTYAPTPGTPSDPVGPGDSAAPPGG
jgi:hypothetical protein